MVERLLDSLTFPSHETGIRLVPDELLLLDWVLSGSSRIIPGADSIEDFIEWEALRSKVWAQLSLLAIYLEDGGDENRGYVGLGAQRPKFGLYLELETSEARVLLAIAPTTFRWGTRPDCGFSLKVKLWQFIEGVYHDPERDKDKAPAPGDPKGGPGDKSANPALD